MLYHLQRIVLLFMMSLILLISGCTPFSENNILEEIAPVIFWSIQDNDEGKLEISTLAPPLVKEEKRLLSMKVDLLNQGRKGFNLIYYREMKVGQLRMLFIDENLAKKGIMNILSNALMDPEISERIFIVIVKGNFKNFIQNQLKKNPNLDYFLYRMLKHYDKDKKGGLIIVNLHQFMKMLYSPHSDPTLPVFKVSQNDFKYDGTAFFKNDKFVGSVRKLDDHIMQLLQSDHYLKLLPIPKLNVTLGNVQSNVDMKLNHDKTSLSVKVVLTGNISEYLGNRNLADTRQVMSLNHEIEAYLTKETAKIFKKMQQLKVDPLQVGTLTLHPFKKSMNDEEWRKKWHEMKISVDYQLELETQQHMK